MKKSIAFWLVHKREKMAWEKYSQACDSNAIAII